MHGGARKRNARSRLRSKEGMPGEPRAPKPTPLGSALGPEARSRSMLAAVALGDGRPALVRRRLRSVGGRSMPNPGSDLGAHPAIEPFAFEPERHSIDVDAGASPFHAVASQFA